MNINRRVLLLRVEHKQAPLRQQRGAPANVFCEQ